MSNARTAYVSKAVTNTRWGNASGGSASTTPNPSTPGIWTSRNTTSGASLRIVSIAATPSAASYIATTSVSLPSNLRSFCRAGRSSSTISTLRPAALLMSRLRRDTVERDADRDTETARRSVLQHQLVLVAIEMVEATLGVAESYSLPDCGFGRSGDSGAVVLDFEQKIAARLSGSQRDMRRNGRSRIAVLERIFNQRLQ